MKSEADSAPSPAPQPAAVTTPYAATQWSTAHIPIDPALQQQSQQATPSPYPHYQYTSHYPQAAYASHYQYAPAPTTATPQPAAPPRQTAQTSSGMDTADIATLNDAIGSAGVDLRAEEESLQRSYDPHQSYRAYEDRTRKQPLNPSFDTRILGTTMRAAAAQHKVTKVPDDAVNYLALALRARLQDLVTAMAAAARHRTDGQFDRPATAHSDGTPMWSLLLRSDVAKQIAALEKVEREEEMKVRRERKERTEMAAAHAAALAAQAAGGALAVDGGYDDFDGNAKKKRKKEGPGVTARNMSEDVRKKMSNAVASQAAGIGGKYSWMTAANAAATTPKVKQAATPAPAPATPAATGSATTTAPAAGPAGAGSTWARPYVPTKKSSSTTAANMEEDTRTTVTLRDAMFVVEKERGHGGGRGAAMGWV